MASPRAALAALALVLSGCLAPPPAADQPIGPFPAAAQADSRPASAPVRADSPERFARGLTLRVRASGCGGVSTGSGFAVARRALITNRHVVAQATEIQVNTWDGRSYQAVVARATPDSDLALIVVDGDLPVVATLSPEDADAGDGVTVVGFPLGGQQIVAGGQVLDYVIGANLGEGTEVMRLSTGVEPGNSGGPVLDARGDVTGVVYAIELATSHALAIPASMVRTMLHEPVVSPPAPAC
jgi:S1-C subfamily serine protease